MATIAVLFHERDRTPENYVVHQLALVWQADGHSVHYMHGTKQRIPADILLMHVNLSIVPQRYQEFAGEYPVVLNRQVTDIRKSRISRSEVRPGDSWQGPVIVKSDLNFGGWPEQRFGQWSALHWLEERVPLLRRCRLKIDRIRQHNMPLYSCNYAILDGMADVPPKWWRSSRVVVEKFLPELQDSLYHLRIYQVLGSRWTCTRLASPHPIVKAHRSIAAEDIAPCPEVQRWARERHLDYGKIDYVVYNGEPVVLDINTTTGATANYRSEEALRAARRHLAEGLYSYLP